MSNSFKLCPTHFSRGDEKSFTGGFAPCAPLVTGLQLTYTVCHRPRRKETCWFGRNVSYRLAMPSIENIVAFHEWLGHPGFSRVYHFIRSRNLPCISDETKTAISDCRTCAEVKSKFFKPAPGAFIKATHPWKRLSIDFKGPIRRPKPYLYVVIDEYNRSHLSLCAPLWRRRPL